MDFANDLGSKIESALSGASAEAPTPEPTPIPAPAPAATPEAAPVVSPTPIAPAATGAPVEPAAAGPDDDDFAFSDEQPATPKAEGEAKPLEGEEDEKQPWDKMLPKEVESTFLQTNRGRKMLQSFKMVRELEKPPSDGGLGFVPSIEQAKEAFQLASDARQMLHEFHVARPAEAQNFIQQWFLQDAGNGQPTPGALQAASQFLPTLAAQFNTNPVAQQLYRAAAMPAILESIEEMYRHAGMQDDPEQRTIAFNVARYAENYYTGKFRPIAEEQLKAAPQPQGDPKVVEIDSKLQRINQFEQQQIHAQQQRFQQAITASIHEPVMNGVQEALSPLKDVYSKTAYTATERQFHQDLVQKVNQFADLRSYRQAVDLAGASPTQDNIRAAGQAWWAAARPYAKALRTEYLKDASAAKQQESAQRHATLTEASQKHGSASVAQPVGKDLGEGVRRLPGEPYEKYLERRIAGVMQVAGQRPIATIPVPGN